MESADEIPTQKSKRLTSVVWNHFERIRKADMQYAVCLHCKKKLSGSSNSGTTHLRNHLMRCLKRSDFDVAQILSAKRPRKQSTLGQTSMSIPTINHEEVKPKDGFFSPMPLRYEPELKREETNQNFSFGSVKFDQERSRLDLAKMIMLHGYPLAMVDHVGFKTFVKNLQPMFEIDNNGSIELECVNIYEKEKQKVFEAIRHLQGRINLAVDMWHSSESSEYICLTANYIDDDWILQKKMLNFISLDPSHTDDILSDTIIKSLKDWSIDRKLFSMTFDDCGAYEIMVSRVKDWLSQSKPLFKNGELFDVRCIAHLLKSTVQEVTEACRDLIEKIRGSIRHVKSTQDIMGKFNDIACQLEIKSGRRLILDTPMQWNSLYLMLEAALDYSGIFCVLQGQDLTSPTVISEDEWKWAGSVTGFLKFLHEFTNVFVGTKHQTTNIFFPEICDMHIQLLEWCNNTDEFVSSLALKMKNKFDVYWNKCSLSLAIAAILDPRFKMKLVEYYFRKIYGPDAPAQIKQISYALREIFNEYSIGTATLDEDPTLLGSDIPSSSNGTRDKLKGFDKFLYESSQNEVLGSDLDKYLEEPVFPRNNDFSILNWWKVHTPRYPILSMMARDALGIPVSTLGLEVAFSNSGRVLDTYHSSLTPETREALMCGQDWLKVEHEVTTVASSTSMVLVNSPLPLALNAS